MAWGDNSAVVGVASNSQSAGGMRHIMRRIKHIQEMVKHAFEPRHVGDKDNVIDFYGKYVSGKKATASVAYLANRRMEAPVAG